MRNISMVAPHNVNIKHGFSAHHLFSGCLIGCPNMSGRPGHRKRPSCTTSAGSCSWAECVPASPSLTCSHKRM